MIKREDRLIESINFIPILKKMRRRDRITISNKTLKKKKKKKEKPVSRSLSKNKVSK